MPGYKEYCAAKCIDPRLYLTWCSMRWRCNNPKRDDYKNYGGRGIKVCARWNTFALFAADMGPHPGRGWTLERKRVNQGYRRGNCRWATMTEQNRNRRYPIRAKDVKRIRKMYRGDPRRTAGRVTQQAIADMFGVNRSTVSYIVARKTWL